MHPRATTTTETISWQWPCGTACKMERRVTISCPTTHGCRCFHGTPSAGAGHHPHQQPEMQRTRALPVEEEPNSGRRTLMNPAAPVVAAAPEGARALPVEKESDSRRRAPMNPTTAHVAAAAAAEFWVPDPCLMVQQLREFESLNDEAVALRVQLEEYGEEIERSKRGADGRNWFLALPENVRSVLVMARDAIDTYIAISTPPAK